VNGNQAKPSQAKPSQAKPSQAKPFAEAAMHQLVARELIERAREIMQESRVIVEVSRQELSNLRATRRDAQTLIRSLVNHNK
jgi:hypothetical protein